MTESLIVQKDNLQESSIISQESAALESGQVRLKVERFAMTANNITYAVIGSVMRYWEFFPTKDDHGIIPVWGFATVAESKSDDVKEGERFYGYYPMATELVVQPGKISIYGFTDIATHRQQLPPIYNNYSKMPSKPQATDNHLSIFRPLYTTSFLNHDFLKHNEFFGATQIILTSASSKTAMGIAQLLTANKSHEPISVIGLTSDKNKSFVTSTNYYDTVLGYEELDQVSLTPTVIVDLSGNTQTLVSLSEKLDDNLKFCSLIGLTDYSKTDRSIKIPNSKFFFAPDVAVAYFKRHGRDTAEQLIQEALTSFMKDANKWIDIQSIDSLEALNPLYKELLIGKVDPKIGYMVSL